MSGEVDGKWDFIVFIPPHLDIYSTRTCHPHGHASRADPMYRPIFLLHLSIHYIPLTLPLQPRFHRSQFLRHPSLHGQANIPPKIAPTASLARLRADANLERRTKSRASGIPRACSAVLGVLVVVAGGRGKRRSRKEKKTEFTWTSLVEVGVLDPADDSVARHHVMTDHITRGLGRSPCANLERL